MTLRYDIFPADSMDKLMRYQGDQDTIKEKTTIRI